MSVSPCPDAQSDWLDELLQPPPIDDDGFSERVSAALPKPRSWRLVVLGLAVLAASTTVVLRLAQPEVLQALAAGLGAKLLLAAGVVVAAAMTSLAGWRLNRPKLLPPAGGSMATEGGDTGSSATAIAAIHPLFKRQMALIERSEDLDEETAWEVVRAARKHRTLFGTVWFFFLAAPFIIIAFDSRHDNDIPGIVLSMLMAMMGGGFFLGTPIVWFTSRQAFFRECEQLGITKKLARRLRLRLSIANVFYSPVDERDARAVARLRGLPMPKHNTGRGRG